MKLLKSLWALLIALQVCVVVAILYVDLNTEMPDLMGTKPASAVAELEDHFRTTRKAFAYAHSCQIGYVYVHAALVLVMFYVLIKFLGDQSSYSELVRPTVISGFSPLVGYLPLAIPRETITDHEWLWSASFITPLIVLLIVARQVVFRPAPLDQIPQQ